MDFFDYETTFDSLRRQGATFTAAEFLKEAERQIKRQSFGDAQRNVEFDRYQSEIAWINSGSPYFKIWPGVIPLLGNVSIDVPSNMLRQPFPAFVLRLPKTDNPLQVSESLVVQSVLVLAANNAKDIPVTMLWIDIGEKLPDGSPMMHWQLIQCDGAETLDEAFNKPRMDDLPGITMSDELRKQCLRLAVSVCFLSTGMDRLIEPDILSKDIAAYIEAKRNGDAERIETIEQRAIRRGKRGWNVGQYERLRAVVTSPKNADAIGTRGPLSYQHQRRAHFRKVSESKVIFVRQATVRPDLPPPEHAPGYGVR